MSSQTSRTETRPVRKKQKQNSNAATHENLRGALEGLRVYVIHCKDSMDGVDWPVSHTIVKQVRALVEAQGLGADIRVAEQGMLIGMFCWISFMLI
jgi:3',5'-cyclic-nucleotide phosphodiesterase